MDLSTFIGLIGGFAIIFAAMMIGSDVMLFVSIPSFMVVIGGTLMATMIKFSFSHLVSALKAATHAFRYESLSTHELIRIADEVAFIVRKQGTLALDENHTRDPFFDKACQLMADGHTPEFIQSHLYQEMEHSQERHEIGQRLFRGIGESAPAFGMIGTLVGLVQMLNTLDDPGNIGPAMAVALLTTLYGALIAHLVAIPIADKLELRSEQEEINQALIIKSIESIIL